MSRSQFVPLFEENGISAQQLERMTDAEFNDKISFFIDCGIDLSPYFAPPENDSDIERAIRESLKDAHSHQRPNQSNQGSSSSSQSNRQTSAAKQSNSSSRRPNFSNRQESTSYSSKNTDGNMSNLSKYGIKQSDYDDFYSHRQSNNANAPNKNSDNSSSLSKYGIKQSDYDEYYERNPNHLSKDKNYHQSSYSSKNTNTAYEKEKPLFERPKQPKNYSKNDDDCRYKSSYRSDSNNYQSYHRKQRNSHFNEKDDLDDFAALSPSSIVQNDDHVFISKKLLNDKYHQNPKKRHMTLDEDPNKPSSKTQENAQKIFQQASSRDTQKSRVQQQSSFKQEPTSSTTQGSKPLPQHNSSNRDINLRIKQQSSIKQEPASSTTQSSKPLPQHNSNNRNIE